MKAKTTVLSIMLATFLASTTQAQVATPSLQAWQPMREAVFDSMNFSSTASPEERKMAQYIWANELATKRTDADGPFPGFVLIGDISEGSKRIVFSMYKAAGSEHCEPAANGASAHDIFVKCRMRVTGWPPTGRQIAELPGYCMMYGGDLQKNRVEYRYETAAQTVHFRTIQYGKVVPVCNRSLKLG